ncbi:MAG: universal stress protein [Bacteroidota bacterium]|nr:universal stress protein [Bacteroidota bacterium]
MIKKAILATDLSEASELLLSCNDQLKNLGIEHITLFHALGVSYMNFAGITFLDKTKAKLEKLKETFKEKGFSVDIVIKEGIAHYELVEYGKENPDSILVLGSKGEGFLKRILLGSTARETVRLSENPVLLIRMLEEDEELSEHCKLYCRDFNRQILFPTDFSDSSEKAFQFLKTNVAKQATKIVLMHVQSAEVMKHREQAAIDEFDKIDMKRLERLRNALKEFTSAEIKLEIKHGIPSDEIIKTKREYDCTLIVMGAQGRGFISEEILGSTTQKVIERVKVDCLIVPSQE